MGERDGGEEEKFEQSFHVPGVLEAGKESANFSGRGGGETKSQMIGVGVSGFKKRTKFYLTTKEVFRSQGSQSLVREATQKRSLSRVYEGR